MAPAQHSTAHGTDQPFEPSEQHQGQGHGPLVQWVPSHPGRHCPAALVHSGRQRVCCCCSRHCCQPIVWMHTELELGASTQSAVPTYITTARCLCDNCTACCAVLPDLTSDVPLALRYRPAHSCPTGPAAIKCCRKRCSITCHSRRQEVTLE